MLFAFVGLVCLATIPLAGGRFSPLADVQLKWVWLAVLGLLVQIVIISVAPDGAAWAHTVPHVISYVLVGAMLVANRRIPWLWLIAFGGVMNFVAIVANDGVMPASAWARSAAGMATRTEDFVNSGVVADPNLLFLGDVFPFPAPWSPNVFSVGDVLIAIGVFLVLHTLAESRLGSRAAEADHARARGIWHVVSLLATGFVVLYAAVCVIAQVAPSEAAAASSAAAGAALLLLLRARSLAHDADVRLARARQRERRGF
jgi:hypothetical protein